MADELPFRGTIATVNDNGFKLEGSPAWINYGNFYEGWKPEAGHRGVAVAGTYEEFKPGSYYLKTLSADGVAEQPPAAPAAPAPGAPPGAPPAAAAAPQPAAGPSPTSYAETRQATAQGAPRAIDAKSQSIERQVALKCATDLVLGNIQAQIALDPKAVVPITKEAVTSWAADLARWLAGEPAPSDIEREPAEHGA